MAPAGWVAGSCGRSGGSAREGPRWSRPPQRPPPKPAPPAGPSAGFREPDSGAAGRHHRPMSPRRGRPLRSSSRRPRRRRRSSGARHPPRAVPNPRPCPPGTPPGPGGSAGLGAGGRRHPVATALGRGGRAGRARPRRPRSPHALREPLAPPFHHPRRARHGEPARSGGLPRPAPAPPLMRRPPRPPAGPGAAPLLRWSVVEAGTRHVWTRRGMEPKVGIEPTAYALPRR